MKEAIGTFLAILAIVCVMVVVSLVRPFIDEERFGE